MAIVCPVPLQSFTQSQSFLGHVSSHTPPTTATPLHHCPPQEGRRAALQVHSRKLPLAPDVDLAAVAAQTHNYTGGLADSLLGLKCIGFQCSHLHVCV